MNLYTFESFSQPNPMLNGAPRLMPAGMISGQGANYIAKDSASYGLIDVINKFQWTTSPKSSRQEVPNILLKEKRLKNNALYAQVAYYGLALGGVMAGGLGGLTSLNETFRPFAQALVGGFGAQTFASTVTKTLQNITSFINGDAGGLGSGLLSKSLELATTGLGIAGGAMATPENIQMGLNTISQAAQLLGQNMPSKFNIERLASDTLQPYEGLYITEDTKFIYSLPYFSDEQNSINNAFGDFDEVMGQGGLDPLNAYAAAQNVRAAANFMSGTINFDAPGIYIEKPKFFNFKEQGEQIRFRFPLINTGWSTYEDVCQNWQLMYLLTYQNRPNRRSRDFIDPAVIYELTIPGVRFYPFAYISDMSINFVGARRRMNLTVPLAGGSRTINTIIPDAYVIDITLTTLVSETQNFLFALLHDKQDVITTVEQRSVFDIFAEEARRGFNRTVLQSQEPTTRSGAQQLGEAAGNIINFFKKSPVGSGGIR